MATIGQVLNTPESGWRRYNDTNPFIEYTGTWIRSTNANYYDGYMAARAVGSKAKFFFEGTKIRIIGNIGSPSNNSLIGVSVDGIEEEVVLDGRGGNDIPSSLVYEKENLTSGIHVVEITLLSDGGWIDDLVIDAIDINVDGELRLPYRKMILKNPTTNQYYSLAEKTLIPLADTSSKNMILHGVEAGKEIQLDEDFDKINYPVEGVLKSTTKTQVKPLSIKFE